jgi:predicted NBD/HSP70 family sugar kinase
VTSQTINRGGVAAPVRRGRPRQRNQEEVIDALLERQQLTQQALVHQTGLSRATVTRIVSTLIERNLVTPEKAANAESPTGVPTDVLFIQPKAGIAMGIDLGRNHLRVAVRDVAGGSEVIEEETSGVDTLGDAEGSLKRAAELARRALAKADCSAEDLVGVYVGVPFAVDFQGRIAAHSGMPAWKGVRPAEKLERRLRWPTTFKVANDANLGAVAELEWGTARGYANAIYVKWSTSIGGGIIVNGKLVRGSDGLAGEIGHTPVPGIAGAVECPNCTLTGCLETVAGGDALTRQFPGARTMTEVVREARVEANEELRAALDVAAERVGRSLGPLVSAYNPEMLVIGGAFHREAGDYGLIADGLLRGLKQSAYPPSVACLALDVGSQTGKAAARGGVALVLRERLRQFLLSRL